MKKRILGLAVFSITLTACGGLPIEDTFGKIVPPSTTKPVGEREALDNGEINQPGLSIIFDNGEIYASGEAFDPPKTIDCSKIPLDTDAFEDAIDAGAPIVEIKTPREATRLVKTETKDDGEPVVTQETVSINPFYGGVLALCEVAENAKGPDSRTYRIRGLDEWLIKGKDGFISVVGAKLSNDEYSWMLWMSDRGTIFKNYLNEKETQASAN